MPARHHTPLWLWINLLSLDAPLVALVWQDFVARCFPSMLRAPGRWTLGLTVWAIYLADRLIDVRQPASENESSRHRFYRENSVAASVLLAAVLAADLWIAIFWLRPAVFSNGVLVAMAVTCYLIVFPVWRIHGRKWKQPTAAVLFTTGVFIVAWTWTDTPWHVLTWPSLAFAALCAGNMVLVETWEPGRYTPAGWICMMLLAAACVLLGNSRWYSAVALSAAGLAVLDRAGGGLTRDARSMLADTALLTPLLLR